MNAVITIGLFLSLLVFYSFYIFKYFFRQDKDTIENKLFHLLYFENDNSGKFMELWKQAESNNNVVNADAHLGNYTFLQYCADHGYDHLVKFLLAKGASPNRTSPTYLIPPLVLAGVNNNEANDTYTYFYNFSIKVHHSSITDITKLFKFSRIWLLEKIKSTLIFLPGTKLRKKMFCTKSSKENLNLQLM